MAPISTSGYNLRSSNNVSPKKKSGNMSQSRSPVKKNKSLPSSPAKQSSSESPSKKQKKMQTNLEDFIQLPDFIDLLLRAQGIDSVEDLKKISLDDLLERVRVTHKDNTAMSILQTEISLAWVRFLYAKSTKDKAEGRWMDWLDPKKSNERPSDRCKVRRGDLLRQRQGLKKSNGPRKSPLITFTDLKEAKQRLTRLPLGKALQGKVDPEILSKAKGGLKKTTSK